MSLPLIIQGGMGVAISDWRLARAVSMTGQLGVVSGTGISRIFTSRLMQGDVSGMMREALSHFPSKESVQSVLERYFISGGKSAEEPYKSQPVYSLNPSVFLEQLTTLANYVEVFLAKREHTGIVGINLLEKVQMPNLASLYGAMLAGVDYVLMGAGIPTQIAGILDKLRNHEPVSYRLDVQNAAPNDDIRFHFDPRKIFPNMAKLTGALKRPKFIPIVSSTVLAQALIKRSEGKIDGFIVETPTAGGHNAPPRGPMRLNERGEPIYGEKDKVDIAKLKELGLPFWLAGGFGHPEKLKEAINNGAAGIQVGTLFSLCDESGMDAQLKKQTLQNVLDKNSQIITNPVISPTGFPFKVTQLKGTVSDPEVYSARERICDLSLLRTVSKNDDGTIVYRCPAEPVEEYVRKGGNVEDTNGRTCLCNNLVAAAGFPQVRKNGYVEPPLVTSGDDLGSVKNFITKDKLHYSAKEVIHYLTEQNNH
ncbi:MAG TPA: nitronate monooxygenase [bacterium]|nr:nitronate monooxygenase [bacterium]HMW32167.1 nitronate monooxygenase [bacterium]HMZ03907.1 nitronate monooxygenase [bacterium]HNB08598.1 nitronate monooxygenase [bacterium]HNB55531.1 nitronate monooxygenase [bacterium]